MRRPKALVDYAVQQTSFEPFAKRDNYYPGLRARAPNGYMNRVYLALAPLIAKVFGVTANERPSASCVFSLATLAPADLNLAQSLPHVDSTDARELAILHFLCDARWGGTAFFRHRATGFESVTDDRSAAYFPSLNADVARHPPARGYIRSSTEIFEQTAEIDARFNRAIIYRGNVLHSGQVDAALGLSADPRAGRLTANTFVHYS
jgi:hypothetical protein